MIYGAHLSQNKQIALQELTSEQKSQHYYIEESDICYFFGEYTAKAGYACSETNQLVLNFKKKTDRKNCPEWKYKVDAINKVSLLLNNAFIPNADYIFIPVPPSKNKNNPLYDDRLIQVLQKLKPGWLGVGYRELVTQINSTEPSHLSGYRDIAQLQENYKVDSSQIHPIPKGIIIFDDVLTTGCHYKAMQNTLKNLYPEAIIIGLFLARRKIEDASSIF